MDIQQKLLELFARTVEARKPDFAQALGTPAADLVAGRAQAATLFGGVIRPDPEDLDVQAAARQRFPDLQGTASLFADGLAKNADIVEEVAAAADVFRSAVALDQAIGRFIYAGELFVRGGDTGEVLAGAAAQQLCDDTVDQARARIKDPGFQEPNRSDVSVAFEEPFRLQEDQQKREQQAQAVAERAAQPYLEKIEQANQDETLARVVDAYLSAVTPPGGRTP